VIQVSTTGELNTTGFDQQITLEGVNLVNGMSQIAIINNLIADGKLLVAW